MMTQFNFLQRPFLSGAGAAVGSVPSTSGAGAGSATLVRRLHI